MYFSEGNFAKFSENHMRLMGIDKEALARVSKSKSTRYEKVMEDNETVKSFRRLMEANLDTKIGEVFNREKVQDVVSTVITYIYHTGNFTDPALAQQKSDLQKLLKYMSDKTRGLYHLISGDKIKAREYLEKAILTQSTHVDGIGLEKSWHLYTYLLGSYTVDERDSTEYTTVGV